MEGIISDILVVFPIKIPIPFFISRPVKRLLVSTRVIAPHAQQPVVPVERKASQEAARNADSSSATPIPNDQQYQEDERVHFNLGLTTAPVIGVLLLLASTSIGGRVLRNGIVGIQGVKPYDIMTLFISLVSVPAQSIAPGRGPNVLVNSGVHFNLVGLYWAFAISRILGCVERRDLGAKALCLFLSVLLYIWRDCGQRELTSANTTAYIC